MYTEMLSSTSSPMYSALRVPVRILNVACLWIVCFLPFAAKAQFNLGGQLLQRGEFRQGYGRLLDISEDPAVFITHRARLQAGYVLDNKLELYMSVQDVRIWGSTPQVKATDPYLSLHEAWGLTRFNESWSMKLGRQELNYDNFRFLGNLDWAMQARAHDFALVRFERNQLKLHFGAGYNSREVTLSGNEFLPDNQYKTAQLIRLEHKWKGLHYSLLFWNDGRQLKLIDDYGNSFANGMAYRQTWGLPTLCYQVGALTLSGFLYGQSGRDERGTALIAHNHSLQVSTLLYSAEENRRHWKALAGYEILSGGTDARGRSRAYNPLYGTNHLFNGYMDFFYVDGRHVNNAGLVNPYLKFRYTASERLFLQLDGLLFLSHSPLQSVIIANDPTGQKLIGSELDLSCGGTLFEGVSVQVGYSAFFAGKTFMDMQGLEQPRNMQHWAYVMLIYRPQGGLPFVGIKF